ncbi:hypothetical protein AYL99_06444 [Fonsecaea erecta]|uniref:Uncharacterized protein n=1 Tax=Fonsecaea erecta TaxID=1367422 RepID=A0A178ZI71_9EURO|nr:hypothetical protein AYL99_06444 [Fonsecaea erecta]OAP59146.1 hypothetical protein AYL99_06444 [Fonsecaea erecta]
MLARATNPVNICLRCQRNLARVNLSLPSGAESVHNRGLRRWQSVATHQLPHEEVGEVHEDDAKPSSEGIDAQLQATLPSRPNNLRRLNFRKWKPKPTAQLGVNSLGKPAEVLLLPTRDRRIPQVPKDEGKEKMLGSTLQESIASENVPLSGQKLAENIEQVRALVGKMRGQLEKHEWTTLKRHLHSGFQKQQLRKYIRLRRGNFSFPEDLEKCNKRDLIKYLVEEVWGFTTPVHDESVVSTSSQSKMALTLTEPVKFDHLLMHPSQPLKTIAEEFDVQIDVYPSQFKIRTMGSKANAQQALQRISRYAKNLGQIVIQLKGTHRAMYQSLATRNYLNSYLKSIQLKYPGLTIGMDEQCIRIVHLANQRGADQARREILLSVSMENVSEKSLVWPRMDTSASTHQPFPTPPEFPALFHQSPWLRLVSTTPGLQTSNAGTRTDIALAPVLQGLQDAFDQVSGLRNADSRQELYYDVTAKFGQALMQELPHSATGTVNDGPPSSTTLGGQGSISEGSTEARTEQPEKTYGTQRQHFVGGGAFLAQHLALMEPWVDHPRNPSQDIDKHTRAILRLELSPVPISKDLPSFEVFVTAGEAVGGQRPRLKIIRVSAIHQEKHFTVLCPHSHVDVQFTQRLKQDLVYPGSSESDTVQLLTNALRAYVGNAQGHSSSDWVFLPFVGLQVHPDLREAHKGAQRVVGKDEKQGTHREAATAGKKSSRGMAEKKQEYILRSVDVIDIDSRLFLMESFKLSRTKSSPKSTSTRTTKPTAKSFCLDHVTYTGTTATRQEIRLAERPLLCSPTLTQPDLPVFVQAALDIVKRLDRDPVKAPMAKMAL